MANIIECRNLSKSYKDIRALNRLNFSVPDRGGIVGLLGPNGSGKTTFIKLLTGLLTPTEGSIRIAGYPIGVETKSIVSYLSDAHSLNESFTVIQELDYFEEFFLDFDREKALRMIRELHPQVDTPQVMCEVASLLPLLELDLLDAVDLLVVGISLLRSQSLLLVPCDTIDPQELADALVVDVVGII